MIVSHVIAAHPAFRHGALFTHDPMLNRSDAIQPVARELQQHARRHGLNIDTHDALWETYNHLVAHNNRLDVNVNRCHKCRGTRVDMRMAGKRLCPNCNGTNKLTYTVTLNPVETPEA